MAKIGERATLKVLREKPCGLYLDGEALGEILLPRREMPATPVIGEFLDVFLYHDSEDRPVATLKTPKAMAGQFTRLKCVAVTGVGAFLDWGLPKELLVPFREQKTRMVIDKSYLVYVHVDKISGRIIATTRIARQLDLIPHTFKPGDVVNLIIFGKTDLGYKAIINGTHSGLIFASEVFQNLQPGECTSGYVVAVRDDGKIDLSLQALGRSKVMELEESILRELSARGGYWAIGDHTPAADINEELGVSKRTFKQAIGALMKKNSIMIEERGIRLMK